METRKCISFLIITLLFGSSLLCSCEKENSRSETELTNFESLESPYLICANRNPGGIGFDFEYKGGKGGAANMDLLSESESDFRYDLIIKTIKAEKPDGSLAGAPYIQLYKTVKAVNYSTVDVTCKGYSAFQVLNKTNIRNYTLASDESGFDITSVSVGLTGNPLLQPLMQEYDKLAIGQRWKEAANNAIQDDEPVWIIQTREGEIVKFIVTRFPADPAPTSTGYISIQWDFLQ
jgi:hypothetical protein